MNDDERPMSMNHYHDTIDRGRGWGVTGTTASTHFYPNLIGLATPGSSGL